MLQGKHWSWLHDHLSFNLQSINVLLSRDTFLLLLVTDRAADLSLVPLVPWHAPNSPHSKPYKTLHHTLFEQQKVMWWLITLHKSWKVLFFLWPEVFQHCPFVILQCLPGAGWLVQLEKCCGVAEWSPELQMLLLPLTCLRQPAFQGSWQVWVLMPLVTSITCFFGLCQGAQWQPYLLSLVLWKGELLDTAYTYQDKEILAWQNWYFQAIYSHKY